jgi:TolB-like protein
VDGLTEEILNRIAQINELKVPGRTSCFAFKGKNADLRQVGAKTGCFSRVVARPSITTCST